MEGRLDDVAAIVAVEEAASEVQAIDWAYWQGVNPDIVAWITIPGTAIDHPVVQANDKAPQFYLTHDVYGAYNPYGAVYVDAACTIESANVYLFGHNMGRWENAMFSDLDDFLDTGFLQEHATVIIQTPDSVYNLRVRAAQSISPYGYDKQTAFSDVEGLREFYLERWQDATARSDEPDAGQIDKLFTLITCTEGANSRALVYAPVLSS
jgi:sortase B